MISIRGVENVRGTSRWSFYVSCPNDKEKTQPSPTPSSLTFFTNCYHRQGALIHVSIDSGLDEGEAGCRLAVLGSELLQSVCLRIRPTLRDLRGRNIIGEQVVNKRRSMAVGADVPYSARTLAARERYGKWERGDSLERG